MGNRKRILVFYRYTECDSLAAYLEEMARKGWHFVEWRLGLVFEKGAPADVVYAVEVFPQGKEDDRRPGEEAEEYGEYCEAAGWQPVDSWKKFCVFRRTRKDAVPIVTPKERLQNVWKAEGAYRMNRLVSPLILISMWILSLVDGQILDWLFSDVLLAGILITSCSLLIELYKLLELGLMYLWKTLQLKSGRELFFGSRSGLITGWQHIRTWCYMVPFIFLAAVAGITGQYVLMWAVIALYVFAFVLEMAADLRKTSRDQGAILSLVGMIAVTAVLLIYIVAAGMAQEESWDQQTDKITVKIGDQTTVELEINQAYERESILGTRRRLDVDYVFGEETGSEMTGGTDAEGTGKEPDRERTGDITVTVYESDCQQLLEYCWRKDVEKILDAIRDGSSEIKSETTELTETEKQELAKELTEELQTIRVKIEVGTDQLRGGIFYPGCVLYFSSDAYWDVETLISVVENCL